MIVCVADAMKPGITSETQLELPAYVPVSGGHRIATMSSITMTDLSDEQIVLLDLPFICECYATQFDRAGVAPNIVTTATSLEMVRRLVECGGGCAVFRTVTANDITYASDAVVAVPLLQTVQPFRFVLWHLPGNPRLLLRVLADRLQNCFVHPRLHHLPITADEGALSASTARQ